MALADIELPEIALWHCHLPAWRCFEANANQWRTGMAGATALDYTPCYLWCEDQGIKGAERSALMADLKWIEAGALQGMQEARENT